MSRVSNRLKNLRKSFSRRASSWLTRTFSLRDPRRDLSSILQSANSKAPLIERIFWAAQLVDWLRGGKISEDTNQSTVRVRFLLQLLDRQPEWKAEVGSVILSLLEETEAPYILAQTELTDQNGFITEFFRRLFDRFVPLDPRPQELNYVVAAVFTNDHDPEWIEAISEQDWLKIAEILEAGRLKRPEMAKILSESSLTRDVSDAVVKLSIQTAALAFASDVRTRLKASALSHNANEISAFITLNSEAVAWREKRSSGLRVAIAACEECLTQAFKALEKTGVSLALVYRLETMSGLLKRLELLVDLFETHQPVDAHQIMSARDLLLEIVRTHRSRKSITTLLRVNFDIFARKLIEHAGETGEHYITRTPREYFGMFKSGAGGGLITVITTLAKFAISALKLPPFVEGLFVWANYSTSFIAMQTMGFALATKQPSMTAAALAGKLSERLDRSRLSEFVDEVARITRSQFIAAVGNVGFVIPGAIAVDVVYKLIMGHHVLSGTYAVKTLETFHPWKSGTIAYAALTGVILWASSFGAGWLQNWVIFRRLDEAVAHHRRLQALIGPSRAKALGEWINHNASGWGGNLAIGFMLAFVPISGNFLGLPLDIRHITLSSGSMAFAFRALEPSAITWELLLTCGFSLAMIGIMNFSVATACALIVAVRARKVRKVWFYALLSSVRRAFFARPLPFFFPPRESKKRPQ